MMKNLFHCYDYTKKNDDFRIYLYTNEKILILKLIDQNRNNFLLNENDIKFIGSYHKETFSINCNSKISIYQ